jgi:hypothetical protein
MSLKERIEKLIGKGISTSKEVFETAKEKTKEIKEKTALKIEIKNLENEAQKRFTKLGITVYELLEEKGQNTVSKGKSEIKDLLKEIKELEKKVATKEEELKKL